MAVSPSQKAAPRVEKRVSRERLLGSENRWRRFGEPVPAGGSLGPDGAPDFGVFGPGTVAWEVLLHPATIFFQFIGQQQLQLAYRPIAAGIRDRDPIFRRANAGTVTLFDLFERAQRNSGIHAPMWLGDRATAARVATHLRNIHERVAGEIIDVGAPELGGYAANQPRDSMWAALTEMHTMLWLYEGFAFRDGHGPRRLPAEQRDRFMAEVASYCALFPAPEGEIPTSMAEIAERYDQYAEHFTHSSSIWVSPENGADQRRVLARTALRNLHPSQWRVLAPMLFRNLLFGLAVTGSLSGKARLAMGYGPVRSAMALAARRVMLPAAWLVQQPRIERVFMRLMWGPDAMMLIDSARRLRAEHRAGASR